MQITTAFRISDPGRIGTIALAVIVVGVGAAAGQVAATKPPKACSKIVDDIREKGADTGYLSDLSQSPLCFWEAFSDNSKNVKQALRTAAAAQKASTTTQVGAPPGSSGTTSAVSKPDTPILSLASEYGGVTSSTSNQTMTLQTTLDGIPTALAGKGIIPFCWSPAVTIPDCLPESYQRVLNRLGFGVSANTSQSSQNIRGTASSPQGTAQQASLSTAGSTAPSFSSVFAKFTIIPGTYQPASSTDTKRAKSDSVIAAASTIKGILEQAPESSPYRVRKDQYRAWQAQYKAWRECINKQFTKDKLVSSDAGDLSFARYYLPIGGILFGGQTLQSCDNFATALTSVPKWLDQPRAEWEQWQQDLAHAIDTYIAEASIYETQMLKAQGAPVLTFEYDFNTPTDQPTTSTYKLIGSKAFGPKICTKAKAQKGTDDSATVAVNRFTETLNVAGNLYNNAPTNVPGAGTFRSLQAGTETDIAFCTSAVSIIGSFLGNSTLGLTYYYQDQKSPSILKVTPGMPLPGISITGLASSTSSVFASKGPINFVQVKYGLGPGKNVKFPIAVSWSNRTDLITHSVWSAQFGVSYDFSSLLGSTSSSGGKSDQ